MKFSINTLVTLFFILVLLGGCSNLRFPGVHRLTIQQGNVITQAMIDKLKPGMTKSQVRYVLGNPVVDDSLKAERWDYIYTIQIPDYEFVQRKLQVFFIDDRLSYFTGDFAPEEHMPKAETETSTATEDA